MQGFGVIAGAAGLTAATVEAVPASWHGIVESLGVPIALVCWFVYQNKKRDDAAAKKSEEDTAYIRGELSELQKATTQAITRAAAATERQNAVLDMKPCLFADEVREAAKDAVIDKYKDKK